MSIGIFLNNDFVITSYHHICAVPTLPFHFTMVMSGDPPHRALLILCFFFFFFPLLFSFDDATFFHITIYIHIFLFFVNIKNVFHNSHTFLIKLTQKKIPFNPNQTVNKNIISVSITLDFIQKVLKSILVHEIFYYPLQT